MKEDQRTFFKMSFYFEFNENVVISAIIGYCDSPK